MRFVDEMRAVSQSLTLAGIIVLMPAEIDAPITAEQKTALGELHLRRIDVADRVRAAGKPVTFVGPAWGSE